jgi:SagB-type dehydrogenase family enzyme
MRIVRLHEPRRRRKEGHRRRQEYCTDSAKYLSIPKRLAERPKTFFDILEHRRTRRSFAILRERDLSTLLWGVAKAHVVECDSNGLRWQHRNVPSAGGQHPIDIIVVPPDADGSAAVYDPIGHALKRLKDSAGVVTRFRSELAEIVEPGAGTILWLVADYDHTAAQYDHPESLVWRDAGILLAAIHFVAEALDLNCCAYGINGDAWVARVTGNPRLGGMGGCVIGRR